MAAKALIAARKLRAVNRVKEVLVQIAEKTGVELPAQKIRRAPAEIAHVFHLEHIAESLEAIARGLDEKAAKQAKPKTRDK